jgi:hypothetical protein
MKSQTAVDCSGESARSPDQKRKILFQRWRNMTARLRELNAQVVRCQNYFFVTPMS